MSDGDRTNLANADLWIRLVYMIIFGILSALARVVMVVIAILQFLLVLLTCDDNRNLRDLGDSIAQWTRQTYLFLCFASEQKPYPFQDWPHPQGADDGDDQIPELTDEDTDNLTGKPKSGDDTRKS